MRYEFSTPPTEVTFRPRRGRDESKETGDITYAVSRIAHWEKSISSFHGERREVTKVLPQRSGIIFARMRRRRLSATMSASVAAVAQFNKIEWRAAAPSGERSGLRSNVPRATFR